MYFDLLNKWAQQYPSTYAKLRFFAYDKFYIQIEDFSDSAGKDVLTALIPGWEALINSTSAQTATPPAKPAQTTTQQQTTTSGNIDSLLLGRWTYTSYNSGFTYSYWHWVFNDDGTFNFFLVSTAEYSYKGNFSASGGKITFTNVVFTNDNLKKNEPNSWVGYTIERDSGGKDKLMISNDGDSFTGSPSLSRE
jgi:hypothetical protein